MEDRYDLYTTDRATGNRVVHDEAAEAAYFSLPAGWEDMGEDELRRWAITEQASRRTMERRPKVTVMCQVEGCKLRHEHAPAEPKGEWTKATPPFVDTGLKSKPAWGKGSNISTYHDYEQAAERVTYVDGEPVSIDEPVTMDEYPASWDRPAVPVTVKPTAQETSRQQAGSRIRARMEKWALNIIKAELDATIV